MSWQYRDFWENLPADENEERTFYCETCKEWKDWDRHVPGEDPLICYECLKEIEKCDK